MISEHRLKTRRTAFDIKSIIGNNDNKNELSPRHGQGADNQSAMRYGVNTSRKQTNAGINQGSNVHPNNCRSCSNATTSKNFDNVKCHYRSLYHTNEREWLKKMSSAADLPLERAHSMPAFNTMPMSAVPVHDHKEHYEQQMCLDLCGHGSNPCPNQNHGLVHGSEYGENHRPRSPIRCRETFLESRVAKAHQYINNAEKYRFFHSFAPPIAQDLHSRYVMHPGLIPAFTAAYSRPDLIATHHGSRRIRTTFTRSQLKVLERRFKSSHYIVGDERKQLAEELSLNESQVKIWFQNRRTKYKQDKEFEELGKSKNVKRKGEHHVRKWQIETKTNEAQCSSDSEDTDMDSQFRNKNNINREK